MKTKFIIYIFLISTVLIRCSNNTTEKTTEPKGNYLIAYNVLMDNESDNYEVFTMGMDGSNKQNISNLNGVEWTYHSDGQNLFYISDKDSCHRCYYLYVMDAHGNNKKKVYHVRLSDSWMSTRSNGEEIILKPHKSVDSAFHIINLRGKLIARIQTVITVCC